MGLQQLAALSAPGAGDTPRYLGVVGPHGPNGGHPHFWERALSRRQFIGAAAEQKAG